ncbi:MAG TPA: hypothetical protein P5513_03300 [Candidatus Diapherotrites archaeon]|nr:hypothetical protein [Candidatus Diapherotrites archaeon]
MLVRESLDFKRGVDPKSSIGIGLEKEIKDWWKSTKRYATEDSLIYEILVDDNLDDDTKEKWVLFLISKLYSWDVDEWDLMIDSDINPVKGIKDGYKRSIGSLKISANGGKKYVSFSSWDDWSDRIEPGRDISKKFIEKVLSGDSLEYFNYDNYDDGGILSDYSYIIKKNKKSLNLIKEKFIEMGGDEEIANDPEHMIEVIDSDEDFESLKSDISNALISAQSLADEREAYDDIVNKIKNYYGLLKVNMINNEYIAEISDDGLFNLFQSYFGEGDKLVYNPPYYGYNGDISDDLLVNNLSYYIEEI